MIVLVIDIQKGITDDRLYNYETFLESTRRVINTARKNNVDFLE